MIKKFTLLLLAMLCIAGTSKASENLDLNWTVWNNGNSEPTSSLEGSTISFTEQWGGGAIYSSKDVSAYDYLVISLSSVTNDDIVLYISAWDGSTKDGDNEKWTSGTQYVATSSNLEVVIDLNEGATSSYKSNFRSLSIQNRYNGTNACTITSMRFMTDVEYHNAYVRFMGLGDSDLNTGWKGGSDATLPTYSDNVITFGDGAYQGKGWYLGEVDFSSYTKFIVDFGVLTEAGGQIVVEYKTVGQSSTKTFEAGTTSVLVDLNDTYKNKVVQIYIQNAEANAKYTLKRAYAASANYFIFDEQNTPCWSAGFESQTDSYINLYRTISAGNWSTIVLPFDLPRSKITSVFGAGASVAEFTGGDESTLSFTTTLTGDKMSANQPYAIKVSSDFSTATISDVTIVSATPTQSATNWDFVGNYTAGKTIPKGSYYFKDNALHKAATNEHSKINGFRAYFTYKGGSTPTLAPSLNFVIDGTITGIKTVTDNEESTNNKFYNLSGQQIEKPTKGIYIKNGKKYIIK